MRVSTIVAIFAQRPTERWGKKAKSVICVCERNSRLLLFASHSDDNDVLNDMVMGAIVTIGQ